MLSPRLYRTGFIVAALALVVLGFSLRDQAPALTPTISPAAFNGQEALSTLTSLGASAPDHPPGSAGDRVIADQIAAAFATQGFQVSRERFAGPTVRGTQSLQNVIGVRPGISGGSIVVIADRDVGQGLAPSALSGTAALLELARDLSGETLQHSVVLASVSGSQGVAGATHLAASLPGPIDAVLALGDLASSHPHGPIVVPWSDGQAVAPPQLRNTLAATIAAQTTFTAGSTGLGGQFARLAFPLALGDQAPFGAAGIPAATISLAPLPGGGAPARTADETTLVQAGRAVLAAISAVDSVPAVAAPSSYLVLSGKMIPGWAISLFALGLLIPVAMTTLDGLARARRRGHVVSRSLAAVLVAGAPSLVFCIMLLLGRLVGGFAATPPGPVAPGAIPLTGGAIAVVVVALLALAGSAVAAWRLARDLPALRRRSRPGVAAWQGGVAALPAVMGLAVLCVWLGNPYAALLLVPALHLWMWVTAPELRLGRVPRIGIVLLGIVPPLLVGSLYASSLGYGPGQTLWQAILLIAGHAVGVTTLIEWSVVLGCLATALALAWQAGRRPDPTPAPPVTVRGPITYAGPGSLGGTKSALRR